MNRSRKTDEAPESGVREIGAEIARSLWAGRVWGVLEGRRPEAAREWAQAREIATQDTRGPSVSSLGTLATLGCAPASTHAVAGLLESVGRDLRFVLALSDPSTQLRGFAPKPDDVFAMLLDLDRRVEAASKLAHLEHDATILALHATACGAFPAASKSPDEFRELASPFEFLAKRMRADAVDVEAAIAVCHAIGAGDGRELADEDAERLIESVRSFRASLEGERSKPGTEDDDGSTGSAPPPTAPPASTPPSTPSSSACPSTLASPWKGLAPTPRAPRRVTFVRVVRVHKPRPAFGRDAVKGAH
jgi:hypothetical protein